MYKFIGKSNGWILCKPFKSEILRLYSIVHVAAEIYEKVKFYLSIKIFHQYIFQVYLPSYSLWAEYFSCHDLANDIQSQTAKTVFSYLNDNDSDKEKEKEKGKENEKGKDCKKIVNCKS